MFFKKLKSIVKRKRSKFSENSKVDVKHPSSINFWTAGIKFDSRLDNLLTCKVKDVVYLIREPENEMDKNAIHVMTSKKKSLGYVGKNRAILLSQMLDTKIIDNVGYIVTLQSDLKNELYGVKISLPVPEEIFYKFKRDKLKEIDFAFEKSSNQNLYLLLDCEKNVLNEVKTLLKETEISIDRTGISYAPSSSGKLYKWYIRIDNDSDKTGIEKLLRDNFPVLKEKYDDGFNEEYLELQEEELTNLEVQRDAFQEEIDTLKKSLQGYIKRDSIYDSQFEKMIKIFLPDVKFERDSIDVLKKEVQDYTGALTEISKIHSDLSYKGTPVKTLNKWYDTHFSTGQKNDGRIYFKRKGSRLEVLVSFKSSQKKDISYLNG